MKIALACAATADRDIERNLSAMLDMIKAVSGQADMIVFGESALQGFDCLCWDYAVDREMAVSQESAPIARLRSAAREHGLAVSFGYIECVEGVLYSSQMVIDPSGATLHNFHRVSFGWKEPQADERYREGERFECFSYGGKCFAIGLCGDLWTEGRPEEMKALSADLVLWPVYCDYDADEWNTSVKHEYAEQASLCGENVLFVNPFCVTGTAGEPRAAGGAAHFQNRKIISERPAGEAGYLIVEL